MREYTEKLRQRGKMLCTCAVVLLLIGTPLHVQALKLQQERSHLIVEDASGHWLETNDLDIFGSGNDKKLIMDGSQGEYAFSIYNHGEYPSKYLLTIKESNQHEIPIEYQLLDKNGKLLSGTDWQVLTEPLQYEQKMQKEQKDDLVLRWRWKPNDKKAAEFENGAPYTVHLQIDAEHMEKSDYLDDVSKNENETQDGQESAIAIDKTDHESTSETNQKDTLSKDHQSVEGQEKKEENSKTDKETIAKDKEVASKDEQSAKEQEEKEANSKKDKETKKSTIFADKGLPFIWLGLLILLVGVIFLILARKKVEDKNE